MTDLPPDVRDVADLPPAVPAGLRARLAGRAGWDTVCLPVGELPADVRDRAEIAAYQAYVHVAPGPQSDRWGAVVDAVAEVLAVEPVLAPNELDASAQRWLTYASELEAKLTDTRARVALLTTALTELHDVVASPDRAMYHNEVAHARAVLSAGEEKA